MTAPSQETTSPISDNDGLLPVVFTGRIDEYFKIWIVNVLFSILTLGIYSAWAKVRKMQYFHGHTSIDGHRFRYLARPIQILKGRIIAVAIVIAFTLLSSFSPIGGVVLGLAFLFAFPWLIIQGLRFSLRMTSYRNVRFNFEAKYGETFVTFILLPIVAFFTLYLAMPWVLKKIDQLIHSNIRYGNKEMTVDTSAGTYYLAALAAIGASILIFIVFGIVAAGLGANMSFLSQGQGIADQEVGFPASTIILMQVGLFVCYWIMITVVSAIYKSIIRNHLFGSMHIEDVARFKSDVQTLPYAWLNFSNSLILIGTLGLGLPIVAIRKTRFLAEATHVAPEPNFASVIDDLGETNSAFGEEAAEAFDVDFSLG